MGKVKMKQKRTASTTSVVTVSVLLSVLITVIGAVILTALVSAGAVAENGYQLAAMAILVLSVFLGGLISFADGKWASLAAAAAIYYLILLCSNILLYDGQFGGIGWGTVAVVLGSLAVVALKLLRQSGHKKTKFKYRYR